MCHGWHTCVWHAACVKQGMLRTNMTLWRIAFLSGLGSLPAACGGHASDVAAPVDPGTPGDSNPQHSPQPTPDPAHTNSTGDVDLPPLRAPSACVSSTPYLVLGVDTGLERCADGRIHRPGAVTCASRLPREDAVDAGPAPPPAMDAGTSAASDAGTSNISLGSAPGACTSDSDCREQPLGHCETPPFDGSPILSGKRCEYGCLTDADCGAGSFCQCGELVGACVAAKSRSDAECGAGMLCAQGTEFRSNGCPVTYS